MISGPWRECGSGLLGVRPGHDNVPGRGRRDARPARPTRIVFRLRTLFPDIVAPDAPPMPEAQPRSPFTTSEVAAAETPGPQGVMTLAVAVVVLAALYFGREVFIPIVVAVLLAFVLAPLVDLLRRLRLGRVPAVIIATLLALGIVLSLGLLIGSQVAQLATDLPRYQVTIRDKLSGLPHRLPQPRLAHGQGYRPDRRGRRGSPGALQCDAGAAQADAGRGARA